MRIQTTERIIHSLKTAFACALGYELTRLVHFGTSQWVIITILVIMCAQANVGEFLHKSYIRFLGTLIGSIIAALTLFFSRHDPLTIGIILTVTTLFFSYIAVGKTPYSDAGTLGAVTVAIVLVGNHPNMITPIERFLEITLGIVIGTGVSLFIFPMHARNHLRIAQAETIEQLNLFYSMMFMISDEKKNAENNNKNILLEEDIIQSLLSQRKLATEAAKELMGNKFNYLHFNQMVSGEREILRCIAFIRSAFYASPNSKLVFNALPLLHTFHEKIAEQLRKIALSIRNHHPPTENQMPENFNTIKEVIQTTIMTLSEQDKIYAYAFLFSIELMTQQVERLTKLSAEMAK